MFFPDTPGGTEKRSRTSAGSTRQDEGAGTGLATGVPAGSGSTCLQRGIIRCLKKRNAIKKSGAGVTGTNIAVNPGKNPGAVCRELAKEMRVPADAPVSPPGRSSIVTEPVGVPVGVSFSRVPGYSLTTEKVRDGVGGLNQRGPFQPLITCFSGTNDTVTGKNDTIV